MCIVLRLMGKKEYVLFIGNLCLYFAPLTNWQHFLSLYLPEKKKHFLSLSLIQTCLKQINGVVLYGFKSMTRTRHQSILSSSFFFFFFVFDEWEQLRNILDIFMANFKHCNSIWKYFISWILCNFINRMQFHYR